VKGEEEESRERVRARLLRETFIVREEGASADAARDGVRCLPSNSFFAVLSVER